MNDQNLVDIHTFSSFLSFNPKCNRKLKTVIFLYFSGATKDRSEFMYESLTNSIKYYEHMGQTLQNEWMFYLVSLYTLQKQNARGKSILGKELNH